VFVPKLVGEIEKMEWADYTTGKATVIRPCIHPQSSANRSALIILPITCSVGLLFRPRVQGLSPRQVRNLLNAWVTDGRLEMSNAARKSRRYRLSAEYRQFIGHLSAE